MNLQDWPEFTDNNTIISLVTYSRTSNRNFKYCSDIFLHKTDRDCYVGFWILCWKFWMFKGKYYCNKSPSWWVNIVKKVNKDFLYLKWADIWNLHSASQKEVPCWMSLLLFIVICSFTIETFPNNVQRCPHCPLWMSLYIHSSTNHSSQISTKVEISWHSRKILICKISWKIF
jgi:hypothetical protein